MFHSVGLNYYVKWFVDALEEVIWKFINVSNASFFDTDEDVLSDDICRMY